MHNVNVYNNSGNIVDVLEINDELEYVNGRVHKGKKCFYKGLGLPYKSHMILHPDNEYDIFDDTGIFYLGYEVSKKCFQNKIGIFQEKYQPQFEDFIGSCGVKELSIIEHSVEFEKSSVDVLKSHRYDEENKQFYFELNYKCDRIGFLEKGNSKNLYSLLEYMITTNWNFIWDKDTITDISYNGLVTDVADIFQSTELKAKLGTVYSVLYSLYNADPKKYAMFMKYCKLEHKRHMDFIFNSIILLDKFGVNTDKLKLNNDIMTYKHSVINYLLNGKNCGHCSYVGLGDQIKEQYISGAKRQMGMI